MKVFTEKNGTRFYEVQKKIEESPEFQTMLKNICSKVDKSRYAAGMEIARTFLDGNGFNCLDQYNNMVKANAPKRTKNNITVDRFISNSLQEVRNGEFSKFPDLKLEDPKVGKDKKIIKNQAKGIN